MGNMCAKCIVGGDIHEYFLYKLSLSTWKRHMPKGCLSTVGRTIFRRKRNLSRPWKVADLERILENEEERIHIVHDGSKPLVCSVYGRACSCYDHRYRRWRHLDSPGYPSDLVCEVTRFSCPEHGVVTVTFEAMVIDGLRAISVLAVCQQLDLGWKAIDGMRLDFHPSMMC